MSGKTSVETEYMGNRKFFKNSYFASFAQMATKLGRRSGTAPIVVAVVAMSVSSSCFLCPRSGLRPFRSVKPCQRQERLVQSGAADFNSGDFQIKLEQLPQHVLRLSGLNHDRLT